MVSVAEMFQSATKFCNLLLMCSNCSSPCATSVLHTSAVSWVGYINKINQQERGSNWCLSDKILTLYHEILLMYQWHPPFVLVKSLVRRLLHHNFSIDATFGVISHYPSCYDCVLSIVSLLCTFLDSSYSHLLIDNRLQIFIWHIEGFF